MHVPSCRLGATCRSFCVTYEALMLDAGVTLAGGKRWTGVSEERRKGKDEEENMKIAR